MKLSLPFCQAIDSNYSRISKRKGTSHSNEQWNCITPAKHERRYIFQTIILGTLPETNSSPLKMDVRWIFYNFLLGTPIFRCKLLVSGRISMQISGVWKNKREWFHRLGIPAPKTRTCGRYPGNLKRGRNYKTLRWTCFMCEMDDGNQRLNLIGYFSKELKHHLQDI